MKKTDQKIEKVRLDKWLFAARFFKTRALALKAIQQGKILYEGQKPNPSREVKIGGTLTIKQGDLEKTIIVEGLCQQRQSAPLASQLYTETSDSLQKREKHLENQREKKLLLQSAPKPSKRPEKGARRLMRLMRRQQEE